MPELPWYERPGPSPYISELARREAVRVVADHDRWLRRVVLVLVILNVAQGILITLLALS